MPMTVTLLRGRPFGSVSEGVDASRRVLDGLAEGTSPEARVRYHAWEPGDVVVRENRCPLHRLTGWDLIERRVLRHGRVVGAPEPAALAG